MKECEETILSRQSRKGLEMAICDLSLFFFALPVTFSVLHVSLGSLAFFLQMYETNSIVTL